MFKMFPPTFFVVPVAWLTIAMLTGLNLVTPLLETIGIAAKTSWVVLLVQGLVTALFVTPAWRYLWRWFPSLNRWVFPDLNGDWDVEALTNWPRIDWLLNAAKGDVPPLDARLAPEDQLQPLGRVQLQARIKQSWADIRVTLWSPTETGPIKESETLAVQPFRGPEGRHGLIYVFEQENVATVVADDRKFLGAARIVIDRDDVDLLCGQMWSDRMWRRGMNTAAEVRFRRLSKSSKSDPGAS